MLISLRVFSIFNARKALWPALFLFALQSVAAQQSDDNEASEETIEEIVVYGGQRPDDKVDLDALYEDELKARLMRDLESIRQEQEEQARWSTPDTGIAETPSRISWGYDAAAESRLRRENDLAGPQRETVQPASVFRVGF